MKITIKKGDTLWSLALQHLGNGLRWTFLYEVNRATIHKAQRGQTRMIGPDWIFPGTILEIPDAEDMEVRPYGEKG